MIKRSVHILQIFVTFWIILQCSGDIDAATNPQTAPIATGIRFKQTEIDFLLNTIHKYNRYLASLSQALLNLKTKQSYKQNLMTKDGTNYENDVIDENPLFKYAKRSPFIAPLPSALTKNDANKLSYFQQKVLAKIRRSAKEAPDEFTPSISVGALADLQGFFEALGQNLESLEEKKLPEDQIKFLERDGGLDQHVRKALFEDAVQSGTKPLRSAAFLHATHSFRPSHKIRSLVDYHPEGYYQTNFHDPYYLHAGLGK
ncbi:uncharacterized protein LOC134828971 [Culicoides brevitarsis]|uniref:uncharacterized protein LOC134828971 n=1 Tax=Culicoides brevitarsis TaxID=469753 RepID=UPI00307C2117